MDGKRHNLKLLAALVICFAVMALFFTTEGRRLSDAGETPASYRIRVILKAKANPPDFWRIVEQGVMVAGEEYGVYCEVEGPTREQDVEAQIGMMEAAIGARPDAIILAAADYKRLVPVCEKAEKQGILVVTVDSDVDFTGRRSFVGTDNYELGRKMAGLVNGLIGADEVFGVVGHVETVTTAAERRRGLLDNIPDAERRMAGIEYCNSSEKLAREQTARMLTEHPEIKCMVGLNESSAIGVANGIRDLGLAGKVRMVACDSSQEMIQLMEDGTIQAFVVQNPFNMGYLAVKTTVELLRGQSAPAKVDTESVIVTKENLYKKENQKLLFPFTGAE